ncbi:MAG TPA: FAD:protein FMN transferase [Candidatus Paceibacterota bacterium]|nr:FAD:protein FMN transferase [Candidatus Paceibacterota bacterium]
MDNQSIRARIRNSAVIREDQGLSILSFHAMGTVCRVSIVEPSRSAANAYLDNLLNWISDFEATYSRFLEGSLISRINAAAGAEWVEVDEQTEQLLNLCGEMYFFTGGAFDPTALPLIRLWNWKANPPVVPSDEAIQQAKQFVGWNLVQRRKGAVFLSRPGMSLDFGGIGKEYAVDMSVTMAAPYGIKNILVDFGQDIRAVGTPPGKPAWHVGLENPKTPGTCWGSVAVTNHAVASSGDYLRCFVINGRRFGHIIDPRSGYPVGNNCVAVNAIAPNCTLAGILTTASFILGPKDGFELINRTFGASGAIITDNGNLITPRFYEHLVNQS